MTNKEPSQFCLKELKQNLPQSNSSNLLSPQTSFQSPQTATNIRPKSRVFNQGQASTAVDPGKYGTIPSSSKLASNSNETEIPEFQRVFGHLRKVPKPDENQATKSQSVSDLDNPNPQTNTNAQMSKSHIQTNNEDSSSSSSSSSSSCSCSSKKSSNFERNPRASFKTNSSIEYASFNIKPSQYKQTGIFLPINNTSTSTPAGTNHLKEINLIRFIKEDLELLIQKLRNLQKLKNFENNFEKFLKSSNDFVDKSSLELSSFSSIESKLSADLLTQNQELVQKLKLLLSSVKSSLASLEKVTSEEEKEQVLAQLSKLLTEFMLNLDKLMSNFQPQNLFIKSS